jgi:hypothetical protein
MIGTFKKLIKIIGAIATSRDKSGASQGGPPFLPLVCPHSLLWLQKKTPSSAQSWEGGVPSYTARFR